MSDTPETDALRERFLTAGEWPDLFAHARRLERERDEARADLATEMAKSEWYSLKNAFDDSCDKIKKLKLALSQILQVNENTPVLIYQKMEEIAKAALKDSVCNQDSMYNDTWKMNRATALQRAEAFLKTIGKWEVAKWYNGREIPVDIKEETK